MKKKHTYQYNPHTLSYEKVIVGVKDKVKSISFTILFGIVLGVVLLIIGFNVIDSPKERQLENEVARYRREMESLNRRMERANHVLDDLQQRDNNIYRVIFQAERTSSTGQKNISTRGLSTAELLDLTTRKIDSLDHRLYAESLSLDQVFDMARSKQERMSSMPAIMPMPKNKCKIVSGFGYRFHPILHHRRMHTGIDLTASKGTAVYATGDGVVEAAGSNIAAYSGYGIVCVVNHGYGFKTLYAHLSAVEVRPGQKVKRGEMIGKVGSTGLSQGPHLHYEVIQNGAKVNPVYFFFNDLSPDEYEQVIDAANQENQCLS